MKNIQEVWMDYIKEEGPADLEHAVMFINTVYFPELLDFDVRSALLPLMATGLVVIEGSPVTIRLNN
jgi:hypothetical protein